MNDKDLKEMQKTAKATSSKEEKPNGYVYGWLNGKKEFFPMEKMIIPSRNNMTLLEFVEKHERLEQKVSELEERLDKRIDEISQAKVID